MAPTGPLHFVVRPLLNNQALDGAFRVHMLPEFLEQVGLNLGDLVKILDDDGNAIGYGLAWRAADRLGSNPKLKPVKMTEMLRNAFGINEGSHVSLSKTSAEVVHADKVMLSDVTPTEYVKGHEHELEDGRWNLRCGYMLGTCDAIANGVTFDIIAKKGVRKRFHVEHVDSTARQPGAPNLYYCDDNTEIVIRDATNPCPATRQPDNPLCESYIGGLLDQLHELNRRMKRVFKAIKETTKNPTNFRINEGILIYGFEGTGKSLIMKRLQRYKYREVVLLQKSTLTAGTTAKNKEIIESIFHKAGAKRPTLILMDDIDKLAPSNEDTYADIIADELDKLVGTHVIVVAACRSPTDVNSSLVGPNRLSALIELPIPDVNARTQIFNVILDETFDPEREIAKEVSQRTHGFTGKDLAWLVQVAESNALDRVEKAHGRWAQHLQLNGSIERLRKSNAQGEARLADGEGATLHQGASSEVRAGASNVGLDVSIPEGVPGMKTKANVKPVSTTGEVAGQTSPCNHPHPDISVGTIMPELTMEDFDVALAKVRPTALREIIFQSPKVHWEDIGGSKDIQAKFDKILSWPLQYANTMKQYRKRPKKGVLLYGPPGCSKTLTAQAVASKYGYNFITVKGAELVSMYVGESERSIREIFRKARQAAPCVIFFDEIDSIASERETGGPNGLNVLTTLLNEMDGFDTLKGVFVLAATNKPEALDPAIMRPGRFDSHFYLGPPNAEARKEIFDISIKGLPIEDDLDLERLVKDTEGYSGAEIVQICDLATDEAMERKISSIVPRVGTVGMKDFEKALSQVKKGITQEMLAVYESFGTN